MSLISCKECGKQVAKNVKKCPHCGTGKNRSFFRNHPILTILGIIFIIGYIPTLLVDKEAIKQKRISEEKSIRQNVQDELKSNSENNSTEENQDANEPLDNWSYAVEEDKMRGTKNLFAIIKSKNILDLGFPYNDSQMNINVRKMNGETNVLLSVKGIFVCDYNTTCSVSIKSDKKEIEQYSYSKAAHGKSSVIFINDERKFIQMLKESQNLIIEAELYDKGRVQYEFDVKGLQWDE